MKDPAAKREYDRKRYQQKRDEIRAKHKEWYLANRERVIARVAAHHRENYVPHPRIKREPKPRTYIPKPPKIALCLHCGSQFEKRGRQFYCTPEHRPARDYSGRIRLRVVRVRPAPPPGPPSPKWIPSPVSVWERGLDYVWSA